jgi:hypothetical protein
VLEVKMLKAYFITALLLSVLVGTMLFMTVQGFTDVSDVPKPSIPEFTVEFVNGAVEMRITNQPFVDYYDANLGNTVFFYYNIRVKEHSSANWIELYNAEDGFLHQNDQSEYTEVSYSSSRWGYETVSFSSGAQVDFQVEAMIGYTHRQVTGGMIVPWVFTGETSGWSATQTLTIGEIQTQTSPEPTSTPTSSSFNEPKQTEQIEIIIGAAITLVVICAGLGLLVYLIKRK